ncbi:MAG: cysteine desulfurase [Candidatus Marsarchaeota archaeon]|jgi:cysteine desulfurase/selenocysteine lyase|nr:cysteine desulfurase [Candidatus Marsarchaeota archaeon]
MTEYNVERIREDFPILKSKMNGHLLAYLDNAATSQRPNQVIDSVTSFYREYNANVHRGIYSISERATEAYEESKLKVSKFINSESIKEIIYTRNTTESINLVALGKGSECIGKDDHILITMMEHHSNIVPWQLLAKRTKGILDYVGLDTNGSGLDMENVKEMLEKEPKIVSISHVSNILGTINDVKEISKLAHKHGALVVVDGAQSVPHIKIDVKEIKCDFLAFSGHKMLAPSGIGVLYGREEILEEMEPVIGGGDMIRTVGMHDATWNDLPWKFEAGTPNIEGGIGMGAAIDYLGRLGMENIEAYERKLTEHAIAKMKNIPGLRIYGITDGANIGRIGVVSFTIEGIHPHDLASILDNDGIAIRAGHNCAMPLVRQILNNNAVARMSFYIYNTIEEVDRAVESLERAVAIFKRQGG